MLYPGWGFLGDALARRDVGGYLIHLMCREVVAFLAPPEKLERLRREGAAVS